MARNNILLSLGSVPWVSLKQAQKLTKETNFDGLELLPTRAILNERLNVSDLKFIKSIHHNWRLDIGQDEGYEIDKLTSIIFTLIRLIFFPKVNKIRSLLQFLSKTFMLPVTVHGISKEWTRDNFGREFKGGISYEIIGTSIGPKKLKNWTKNPRHNIILDLRDDQSLLWAKKYGFNSWKEFWKWIGLKKIKGIQLTLIGTKGIRKILNHKQCLAEEQLLWLKKQKWDGSLTVEINPISLYLSNKGRFKEGLKTISYFVHQTLIEGRKWS